MKNFSKLCAKIILQCCCQDTNEMYNLLLSKLLPSQLGKIKYIKELEDNQTNEDQLYSTVDELGQSDPMLFIILTDDLVDLKDRDTYLQNIEKSDYYPDDLKYLALECFKNSSLTTEDCGDCGGGDLGAVSVGGDVSPLAGEIGCPPPHFSDQFNHLPGPGIPMRKVKHARVRPQFYPVLGMYATYYNKKNKKRTSRRKRK